MTHSEGERQVLSKSRGKGRKEGCEEFRETSLDLSNRELNFIIEKHL